jgi:hypothetical protein
MTLNEVIEAVKLLPSDDVQRLRDWLAQSGASRPKPSMTEEEFHQRLLEKGIISRIPEPITDFTPYANRKPVQVDGPPLSETISGGRS